MTTTLYTMTIHARVCEKKKKKTHIGDLEHLGAPLHTVFAQTSANPKEEETEEDCVSFKL